MTRPKFPALINRQSVRQTNRSAAPSESTPGATQERQGSRSTLRSIPSALAGLVPRMSLRRRPTSTQGTPAAEDRQAQAPQIPPLPDTLREGLGLGLGSGSSPSLETAPERSNPEMPPAAEPRPSGDPSSSAPRLALSGSGAAVDWPDFANFDRPASEPRRFSFDPQPPRDPAPVVVESSGSVTVRPSARTRKPIPASFKNQTGADQGTAALSDKSGQTKGKGKARAEPGTFEGPPSESQPEAAPSDFPEAAVTRHAIDRLEERAELARLGQGSSTGARYLPETPLAREPEAMPAAPDSPAEDDRFVSLPRRRRSKGDQPTMRDRSSSRSVSTLHSAVLRRNSSSTRDSSDLTEQELGVQKQLERERPRSQSAILSRLSEDRLFRSPSKGQPRPSAELRNSRRVSLEMERTRRQRALPTTSPNDPPRTVVLNTLHLENLINPTGSSAMALLQNEIPNSVLNLQQQAELRNFVNRHGHAMNVARGLRPRTAVPSHVLNPGPHAPPAGSTSDFDAMPFVKYNFALAGSLRSLQVADTMARNLLTAASTRSQVEREIGKFLKKYKITLTPAQRARIDGLMARIDLVLPQLHAIVARPERAAQPDEIALGFSPAVIAALDLGERHAQFRTLLDPLQGPAGLFSEIATTLGRIKSDQRAARRAAAGRSSSESSSGSDIDSDADFDLDLTLELDLDTPEELEPEPKSDPAD